jgi:hypothetical protein
MSVNKWSALPMYQDLKGNPLHKEACTSKSLTLQSQPLMGSSNAMPSESFTSIESEFQNQ